MTQQEIDRIECAIRHIQTAVDVDPWAVEIAVEALEKQESESKRCMEILDKIRAEIELLPTNTRINWDGCCPDIDYPQIEYVDVTKNKLLSIIDKYKTGSEE